MFDLLTALLDSWALWNRVAGSAEGRYGLATGAPGCIDIPVVVMAEEARTILWGRIDQPGHEAARLLSRDAGWKLSGTAVFEHERRPCRLVG